MDSLLEAAPRLHPRCSVVRACLALEAIAFWRGPPPSREPKAQSGDPRREAMETAFGRALPEGVDPNGDGESPDEAWNVMVERPLELALALREQIELPTLDALVWAHTVPSGDVDTASAFHIQRRLNYPDALPFSVSQGGESTFLNAVRVTADLCEDDSRWGAVLLATSDVLTAPMVRRVGASRQAFDAAVVTIARQGGVRGWRVDAVANITVNDQGDPFSATGSDALWLTAIASAADAVLKYRPLGATPLQAVIGASHRAEFERAIAERYGVAPANVSSPDQTFLASDLPIKLALAERGGKTFSPGDQILAWSAGLGGAVAAALLTRLAEAPALIEQRAPA
jgi:hypothetical protein